MVSAVALVAAQVQHKLLQWYQWQPEEVVVAAQKAVVSLTNGS